MTSRCKETKRVNPTKNREGVLVREEKKIKKRDKRPDDVRSRKENRDPGGNGDDE